ncbi:hypothetical protein QE152_g29275 [Popillia japonica]|uniref:Uncharacterized protein n=1 Tax=Popillia japonica TaxID=7064 RepID=A0AAW1JIK8_POPJA
MLPSNTTSIYIDVSTYPLRVPLFRSIINPLSEERGRTTRIRSVLSFPFFFLRRPFPWGVQYPRIVFPIFFPTSPVSVSSILVSCPLERSPTTVHRLPPACRNGTLYARRGIVSYHVERKLDLSSLARSAETGSVGRDAVAETRGRRVIREDFREDYIDRADRTLVRR